MYNLLQTILGKCRAWSTKHACWWYKQRVATPIPEIKYLYELAHGFHLIFYWLRLPGEFGLSKEGDKYIREQIKKSLFA